MWKSERRSSSQSSPIKIVGLGAENRIETDVAVLAFRNQLSPTFPMPTTSADLVWGQNVYFLRFYYGLHTSVDVNHGYPLSLIKGAVMSGSIGQRGNPETFLLDGHNNSGFSGGPVVFLPAGKAQDRELCVMAVVSGYQTEVRRRDIAT